MAVLGSTTITNLAVSSTTASTSTITGAVTIAGGLGVAGDIYAGSVHDTSGNDLVDAIVVPEDTELEFGKCYKFDGERYSFTSKYGDNQFIGIHSDTFGMIMGEKKDLNQLCVAVAGFILADVDKKYKSGTLLTCTKDGKLTKIRLLDRIFNSNKIIAKYWKPEPSEIYNDKVQVNGRHWVKVI